MDSIEQIVYDFLSKDDSIYVNKNVMKRIGIDEAILLASLISKIKSLKNITDFFYYPKSEVLKDTNLSFYRQNKAIKKLLSSNLIFSRKSGFPLKIEIKINFVKYYNSFIRCASEKGGF